MVYCLWFFQGRILNWEKFWMALYQHLNFIWISQIAFN